MGGRLQGVRSDVITAARQAWVAVSCGQCMDVHASGLCKLYLYGYYEVTLGVNNGVHINIICTYSEPVDLRCKPSWIFVR